MSLTSAPASTYYRDLRDYLAALEQHGKLRRFRNRINKDTELHPLVRLQFRGLPPQERTGWLFERVVDARGRSYSIPVAVGCLAASREVYALGMQCAVEAIGAKWEHALTNPLPPVLVSSGACQEVVHQGATLLEHGGLDEFPIPISTPGFDNAPYLTAAHLLTKDPVTGLRNLGNYRCMLKAPDRVGCMATIQFQDGGRHWRRARQLGRPLEVALIIGTTPNLSYVSAARVPSDMEEYAVAGGMVDQPVELVKCVSVDLEVPTHSEIVIEGIIPTDELEIEGAFGEFSGYMATRAPMLFINVTAITHRREPIYNAFISQYPPSESTVLRSIGREAATRKILTIDNGLQGILDVAYLEQMGAFALLAIQVDQKQNARPRDILRVLAGSGRNLAKVVVIVDEDLDPRDADQLWHAIGYRAQAPRDMYVVPMMPNLLDPSAAPPDLRGHERVFDTAAGGALLIDATRKWPYAPVSLPRQEYMERARAIWEEHGLPPLQLRAPWYGYPLEWWTEEEAEEAALAVQGRYYETGAKFALCRQAPDETTGT
jgi:4-hydroxy-3-polyprenylbenzoate decarboxylase